MKNIIIIFIAIAAFFQGCKKEAPCTAYTLIEVKSHNDSYIPDTVKINNIDTVPTFKMCATSLYTDDNGIVTVSNPSIPYSGQWMVR